MTLQPGDTIKLNWIGTERECEVKLAGAHLATIRVYSSKNCALSVDILELHKGVWCARLCDRDEDVWGEELPTPQAALDDLAAHLGYVVPESTELDALGALVAAVETYLEDGCGDTLGMFVAAKTARMDRRLVTKLGEHERDAVWYHQRINGLKAELEKLRERIRKLADDYDENQFQVCDDRAMYGKRPEPHAAVLALLKPEETAK